MDMCTLRGCSQRPEEGTGFPAAGVTGSCELVDMVAGN